MSDELREWLCPDCGGTIPSGASCCPYCGHEIMSRAEEAAQRGIDETYRAAEEVRTRPARRLKRATKRLLIAFACVAAAFVVIFAVSQIVAHVQNSTAVARHEKTLQELEEYYRAGEYDEMNALLFSLSDSYSASYGKYARVGELFLTLETCRESAESDVAFAKDGIGDEILFRYDIDHIFSSIRQIDEYESEGFVYGEGDVLNAFRSKFFNIAEDVMQMPQTLIDRAMECAASDDPDFSEIAREVFALWQDKGAMR